MKSGGESIKLLIMFCLELQSSAFDSTSQGGLVICMMLKLKVARTLGKTLRAFQPTIREFQDVSREFKSTIEREIGLDDFQSPVQNNSSSSTTATNSSTSTIASSEDSQMKVDPNGSPSTNNAYSSEDYLKITKEQLKAAATQQQTASLGENQSEIQIKSQDTVQEAAAVVPPPPPKREI